jgi:Rrf2 family protein
MGGYRLAKPPSRITVGDILLSSEGSLNPVSCMDNEPNTCLRQADCLTLPIWHGLSEVISDYLSSITLQDILDKCQESPEYYI